MKKIILVLFLFVFVHFAFAQNEFSSHTLFSSAGFTVAQSNRISLATGVSFGIGYQRNILSNFTNNRLRFVPSLNFGSYRSTHAHYPDAHFSSYNLKTNFNFDLLRIKSFSFFIGTGITLNYMNGYVGTGGYPDDPDNNIVRKKNYYFEENNFAINTLFGFRLNPKGKRLGYELKLIDFSIIPDNNLSILELTPIAFHLLFHLR